MAKELIPITNENGKRAVDARMLHDFLGSKREFATWVKDRIDKCDLIENVDFEVFDKNVKNSNGGRPTRDYALTIDAAKEIAMMEGNERGKQARRYFIEVEKEYKKQMIALPDFSNPAEAARAWADQYEKAKASEQRALVAESEVLSLSKEIEEMQPKVSYYDKILQSVNCVTTTQIAQDYGVSAKAFNQLLKELNIQRKVNDQWILFAKYLGQGYTKSKSIAIRMRNGEDATVLHTYWTQKGRLFLYDILKQNNVLPLMDIDND